MWEMATIVFREFLEIALVVGILMAATRGLKGRLALFSSGLALGALGAACIAFFTEAISSAMDGVGQEIFNAAVMFTAAAFLCWTVVWMRRHGRFLSERLRGVGADVMRGEKPLYAIVAIVALSVFREGAEIALFSYGMQASGQYGMATLLAGGIAGALGGAALGTLLYFGILATARKRVFQVTGWLLMFLAAGMAAQGAGFLVAADVLPALSPELWDTSRFVSADSFLGQWLGVMVGYVPRPSGMEAVFYVALLGVSAGGYFFASQGGVPERKYSAVAA
ncbi:MAG: FTR1 family protein [Rickettsiales bacterium]